MTTLTSYLAPFRMAVTAKMRSVLRVDQPSEDLFWPMLHYHLGWCDSMANPTNLYAGKQIRPILTLLACAAAGGKWEDAVPAAASLEILHNFTLLHDDIEDNSPTRRGRETNWKVWGLPQAINTGDAMFAVAQLAMAGLSQQGVSADITLHCLRRLNEMSLDLTKGQYLDMRFENQSTVTVEEYIAMITGKTAVLISLACELGARIAGASAEIVAQYAQFGLDIGIAFQVCDDILGIWGHEAEIGKSAASDILTKKKSLPVLYGLAHSPELTAHYQLSAETPNFVATAIALLDQTHARGFAEQQAQRYTQSALTALENAHPQEAVKTALLQLTNQLLQRQS